MKWWHWLALALVALFVIGAVLPFLIGDLEQRDLGAAARAEMQDKSFVSLPDGVTHYTWHGPEDGRVVVLVHGFSTPSWVWDHQVPVLTAAGRRVLTYDLYGRGLSDRPAVDYGPELYDRQLTGLLDALGITGEVDVVGLSMGGAISVRFTSRHPERVRKLALIAPAGLGVRLPASARLLSVPGLGAWMMKAFGDRILLGHVDKMLAKRPELAPTVTARYKDQMSYRGYKRALRSTMIHMLAADMAQDYGNVGRSGKPLALIWGTQDDVVPFVLHARALELLTGVEFHRIEDAGHAVNFEEPEKVNPALVEFLGK
jgi:pimeloyl-ACP methyl ester carboxylesterase